MTGLLRHPRHESVALARNKAHVFSASHALMHYASGAVYSFIPKNGCSTMRYSLALANHCIEGSGDWTWIHPNNSTFAASLRELITAPYSFVILRCPYARLASVFLDKIVDKTPELWGLYRLKRDGFTLDELTFRDFVAMLEDPIALASNIHWRPQSDFLVYEHYSDVFALEDFGAAARKLKKRVGLRVADARALTGHGTDRMKLIETGDFADIPVHELAQMKRNGQLPTHRCLYDADIRVTVARLYADDIALYSGFFGAGRLMFAQPATN